jgi:hypothetical protein
MTSLLCSMSPWGTPLVSGIEGAAENGDPWLGLIIESPIPWLRVNSPLQPKEKELFHLQRLAVDYRTATGRELFDAITGEDEAPDFHISSNGQEFGWEMTGFVIRERREAQGMFFEVTSRLAHQQRHRIGHLSGYQVYIWFGAAWDAAGLPFKKNDEASYNELVESLVAHLPDPDQHKVQSGELPRQVEARPVRTTADVQYFTIPLLGGVPASPFYAMTGMHVALAYQSDHTAPSEWAKLRAAIRRKDRPANNVLVISAGAPDNFGRCFVGEEVLADFMLRNPEGITAERLSSVILHFWSTGRAVELLGEHPQELWPALFQGWSPAFHPFAPQRDV